MERTEMLELGIAKAKSVLAYTHQKGIARLFVIDREYQLMLHEKELEWTRALVAAIVSGKIEGLGEWQSFHADADEPAAGQE